VNDPVRFNGKKCRKGFPPERGRTAIGWFGRLFDFGSVSIYLRYLFVRLNQLIQPDGALPLAGLNGGLWVNHIASIIPNTRFILHQSQK
jgi:hypothetical protein